MFAFPLTKSSIIHEHERTRFTREFQNENITSWSEMIEKQKVLSFSQTFMQMIILLGMFSGKYDVFSSFVEHLFALLCLNHKV